MSKNTAKKDKALKGAPVVNNTPANEASASVTETSNTPAAEDDADEANAPAPEVTAEVNAEANAEANTPAPEVTDDVTAEGDATAPEVIAETAGDATNNTPAETAGAAETAAEAEKRKRIAKPAPTVVSAKRPPLAAGKRSGGGGGGVRNTAPTYNVGTCAYNDLQPDSKTGERKFLEFILNGAYFPTFNGDTSHGSVVDPTQKVYASFEEAQKDNAVIFGMKPNMPKLFGYAQNIQLKKLNAPLTGKVHPVGHKNAGEPVSYHCFITATAENVEKVVANMNAYINCPYRKAGNWAVMFTVLPSPFKLTIPPAPATISITEKTEAPAENVAAPAAENVAAPAEAVEA